jgi:hypothetical protein
VETSGIFFLQPGLDTSIAEAYGRFYEKGAAVKS